MSLKKQNKLVQTLFSVTSVILVSKLMGFVKQMITAGTFGATIETDLFSLSEGFIGNIKYSLVQVLLTSFVTIYLHNREESAAEAKQFAVDIGKAFTVIAGGVAVLVVIFANPIARIIAPSYSAELSLRLAGYLRLLAPALVLFMWTAVFHALLNANKRFVPGELEGLNQSVIVIILILTFRRMLGVRVLAVAFLLQALWNSAFLAVAAKPYWELSSGNPFKKPAVKQLLTMAVPLLLGYSVVYINELVGKILVAGLGAGTVTAMGYAAVLSNLIVTVVVSMCSILFTYVTAHISKGEDKLAAELTIRSTQMMLLAFLPISVITFLGAEDIVSIVYERGAFTQENVQETAWALKGYALLFLTQALQDIYSRFQYGYQDSKQPMINSTIGIATNIVLSIVLCLRLGVFGVALASGISIAICGLLNMKTAKRHNTFLKLSPLVRQLPWLCVSGIICAFVAQRGLAFWQEQSALLRFVLVTLTAGGAYVLAIGPYLWRLLREIRPRKG